MPYKRLLQYKVWKVLPDGLLICRLRFYSSIKHLTKKVLVLEIQRECGSCYGSTMFVTNIRTGMGGFTSPRLRPIVPVLQSHYNTTISNAITYLHYCSKIDVNIIYTVLYEVRSLFSIPFQQSFEHMDKLLVAGLFLAECTQTNSAFSLVVGPLAEWAFTYISHMFTKPLIYLFQQLWYDVLILF